MPICTGEGLNAVGAAGAGAGGRAPASAERDGDVNATRHSKIQAGARKRCAKNQHRLAKEEVEVVRVLDLRGRKNKIIARDDPGFDGKGRSG